LWVQLTGPPNSDAWRQQQLEGKGKREETPLESWSTKTCVCVCVRVPLHKQK